MSEFTYQLTLRTFWAGPVKRNTLYDPVEVILASGDISEVKYQLLAILKLEYRSHVRIIMAIIMCQQKFVTSVPGIRAVAEGRLHVSKLCEDLCTALLKLNMTTFVNVALLFQTLFSVNMQCKSDFLNKFKVA